MKSNIVIFAILGTYFLVLAAAYSIWNIVEHGYLEWAGSTTILLSSGLAFFIAYYLGLVQKKQGGVLVEDLEEADIDDGDPELGEFSPWSWWPIFLSGSCALALMGLAIGFNFWLSFLTIPLILVSIVGWVYEYYRGNFAR